MTTSATKYEGLVVGGPLAGKSLAHHLPTYTVPQSEPIVGVSTPWGTTPGQVKMFQYKFCYVNCNFGLWYPTDYDLLWAMGQLAQKYVEAGKLLDRQQKEHEALPDISLLEPSLLEPEVTFLSDNYDDRRVRASGAISLKRIADLLEQDIKGAQQQEDPRIAKYADLLRRAKIWIPKTPGVDKGLMGEIEAALL